MSFTDYHPESWQPAWTISNILHGIVSYMPVDDEEMVVIGALKASAKERQRIARVSPNYVCKACAHTNKELIASKLIPKSEDQKADAKALEAKLQSGMTLREISQLFMLEPDEENQAQ